MTVMTRILISTPVLSRFAMIKSITIAMGLLMGFLMEVSATASLSPTQIGTQSNREFSTFAVHLKKVTSVAAMKQERNGMG